MATILAVDDSALVLQFLEDALRRAGHVLVPVADAARVAEEFAARRPDLLILDFQMPRETGVEVYARLRLLPRGAQLPVIFLSGTASCVLDSFVPASPLVRFLEKPIQATQLLVAVSEALGLPAPPDVAALAARDRELEAAGLKLRRLNPVASGRAEELLPGRLPTPFPGSGW